MTPTRQQYREFYEYLEAHPESLISNIGTARAIIADMEQPRRLTPLQRDCSVWRPLPIGEEISFLLVACLCCGIWVALAMLACHAVMIIWRAL